MFKKFLALLAILFGFSALVATPSSACTSEYMHDSCPLDGYDIVQVEGHPYGVHNHMYIVHHYNDLKKRYKRCHRMHYPKIARRHHLRRYRYDSRCHLLHK